MIRALIWEYYCVKTRISSTAPQTNPMQIMQAAANLSMRMPFSFMESQSLVLIFLTAHIFDANHSFAA